MKIGKISADKLKHNILDKIKFHREDILVHAAIGEDTAVVDFGDEVMVISSDPITGARQHAGYIAVHVACNDLAATGAKPIGIQVVLLFPEMITGQQIEDLMGEIHDTAASLGVEVLGGHTEILSSIEQPLIIITAIGKTGKDKYIKTGGALAGDDLILTKGAGIEGTYVLASDYEELLLAKGVSNHMLREAREFDKYLSVIPEGLTAANMGVHAMHDVTEGGLYGALQELASASKKGFEIYYDKLVIKPPTQAITEVLNIDPAGLISSGSMLMAANNGKKLIKKLSEKAISAFEIGKLTDQGKYIIDKSGNKKKFKWHGKDELWLFMDKQANNESN